MNPSRGFSLFEVMISMTICVVGVALFMQSLDTSRSYAKRSRELLDQQILCQNKLNRIVVGLDVWDEVHRAECEVNANYWYSVHSELHAQLPLRLIEVSVWAKSVAERAETVGSPRRDSESAIAKSTERAEKAFTLRRLIRVENETPPTASEATAELTENGDGR